MDFRRYTLVQSLGTGQRRERRDLWISETGKEMADDDNRFKACVEKKVKLKGKGK